MCTVIDNIVNENTVLEEAIIDRERMYNLPTN